MIIDVGDLKSTRELLCAAQNALNRNGMGDALSSWQKAQIQGWVDQIDTLRPLMPDGKHHDHHTPYCGCETLRQDFEWMFLLERMARSSLTAEHQRRRYSGVDQGYVLTQENFDQLVGNQGSQYGKPYLKALQEQNTAAELIAVEEPPC